MTVTLSFSTDADHEIAAAFVAALVKAGVRFAARHDDSFMTIDFTGGF